MTNQELQTVESSVQTLLYGIRRTFYPDALAKIAEIGSSLIPKLPLSNFSLIQIKKVRYRERKDIKYAMTSLFSALHGAGQPLIYILFCYQGKTSIYLGYDSVKGLVQEDLEAAIQGFTPGCDFAKVNDSDANIILNSISSLKAVNAVVGLPSEKQIFQDEKRSAPLEYGIERLADAMISDNFAMVITAEPVNIEEAAAYFGKLSKILNYVHLLVKTSEQYSECRTSSTSTTNTVNTGGSNQKGNSTGTSEGFAETPNIVKRFGKQIKNFFGGGQSYVKQKNIQVGQQFTTGTNWGESTAENFNEGSSETKSQTVEKINHHAVFAEELLKMLQNRLKTGIGEGLWQTNVLLLSDKEPCVEKASNILQGMWSGAQSHQDPVRKIELTKLLKDCCIENALALVEQNLNLDHPLGKAYSGGYTWLTSGELALEANLPYYELPHLSSEALIEYGRFLPVHDRANQFELGHLVDRNIKTDIPVWMDTKKLNRHLFVTGLTGAGKSNTIRSILMELAGKGIPFMVIEPVKSEYRDLNGLLSEEFRRGKSKFDRADVFSLSGDAAERLVMNPFAFEVKPGDDMGIALISHIDRLKAVFNAALGMYSSMPYILEDIIYEAYRKAGWNVETGKNEAFEVSRNILDLPPDCELRNLFLPRLSDLEPLIDGSIKTFFEKDSDYGISLKGALKSRLTSLSRGVKGELLNQRISLPMKSLLECPCVIELEAFADNDEKAFVMALLLSRIYEYRIAANKNTREGLRHVLVIEEAHRLLAKPPQTGEYSANSRGKSVEVFADMLAEIRAYGQGIVIADQIPAKLIPDVIKNTDVKIVHRLIAKEDREAVGTAMNLNEKQIGDLNRAVPGLATVSFDGLNSPIRVQIREVRLESGHKPTEDRRDMMSESIQNIFLKESVKQPVVLPKDKKEQSYWLVLRIFFIAAICEQEKLLVDFRSEITKKNIIRNQPALFDKDKLWAHVAEGAYTFMSDLCKNDFSAGDAGILVSAFIAFAQRWSNEQSANKELKQFVRIVRAGGRNPPRSAEKPQDILSRVIQMYADRSGLQGEMIEALGKSSIADWGPLEDVLMKYIGDMTYKLIPKNDGVVKIHLMLKLILCLQNMQTNDPAIIEKAGYAYGSLLKLLPESDKVLVTQVWKDVND